jgi:hypothetical protein
MLCREIIGFYLWVPYEMHVCGHAEGFRRVRKIAKSDYELRHVRPSVRMEQLGSHWTDFDETW